MNNPDKWKIRETSPGWDSDWAGDERFHLQYFRALPMKEKIKAVEEMCRLATALQNQRKAKHRKE